jgi:hypothetical protein
MPFVSFGEYRPDVADYQSQFAAFLSNALPRGDGYGPFSDFSAYSAALPGACRGFFKAIGSCAGSRAASSASARSSSALWRTVRSRSHTPATRSRIGSLGTWRSDRVRGR